jgi:hypothetical protein
VNGGATWSSWYNQPTGQFYHLAADNRFPYWIYSGQQDSGTVAIASRSDYGELTYRDWHPVGGDERDYDIPDPADPNIVYGSGLAAYHQMGCAHRTGGGRHAVAGRDIRPSPHAHEISLSVGDAAGRFEHGTRLALSRRQVLFRSQDQGKSWSVISGDLTGKIATARKLRRHSAGSDAKDCGYGCIATIAPSQRNAG